MRKQQVSSRHLKHHHFFVAVAYSGNTRSAVSIDFDPTPLAGEGFAYPCKLYLTESGEHTVMVGLEYEV
jgi:hypothetical protein